MNIRMQLIRAGVALAIIGGVATAETLSPPAVDADCPFAKAAKPQRILLLDPIQKHPTWIDARKRFVRRRRYAEDGRFEARRARCTRRRASCKHARRGADRAPSRRCDDTRRGMGAVATRVSSSPTRKQSVSSHVTRAFARAARRVRMCFARVMRLHAARTTSRDAYTPWILHCVQFARTARVRPHRCPRHACMTSGLAT